MTKQLAPVPLRKVEFTPEACLEAVLAWLEKERWLKPAKSEVLNIEGVPWLSFDMVAQKDDPSDVDAERLLSPLAKRSPSPANPKLADDILIIQIHSSDPTPRTYSQSPNVTVTDTGEPWATIAIVRGKERLEVKDFEMVFPAWEKRYFGPSSQVISNELLPKSEQEF